jgi:CHASE2 domain-containing sensor protein
VEALDLRQVLERRAEVQGEDGVWIEWFWFGGVGVYGALVATRVRVYPFFFFFEVDGWLRCL